jgi:hypothetical protein
MNSITGVAGVIKRIKNVDNLIILENTNSLILMKLAGIAHFLHPISKIGISDTYFTFPEKACL